MKLHTLAPHKSTTFPFDFRVKGQGLGALMIENGFQTITYDQETSYTCSPWVKDVPYWFRSQNVKVKVMPHWWFKWFPDYNWLCNQHMIMNFIQLLLMSQRCALLILGSKGPGLFGIENSQWMSHVHSKGFCNLAFWMFDAPFTCSRFCKTA